MALSKDQKQAQVEDLTRKMSDASSIIYANYIGLSVSEISELRNNLREADAEMKVAKKTLMNLAAASAKMPTMEGTPLEGPVSIIFSYGDPLSGAQTAFKFSKDHDQVAIIGGVYDGKVLSKAEAIELAKMPSRPELLSIFVGMIQSPLVSFASMSSSPLVGFARALNEMADKGGFATEEAAPAPEAKQEEAKQEEAPEETKEETAPTPEAEESSTDEKPEA